MKMTLDALGQPQLVVVRRLSCGPLTEFELAHEVAESSSYTTEQAADRIGGWLDELKEKGLIWAGTLLNKRGQTILAAALTNRGRELVGSRQPLRTSSRLPEEHSAGFVKGRTPGGRTGGQPPRMGGV